MSDKYYVVGRGRGRGDTSITRNESASVTESCPQSDSASSSHALSVTDVYVAKGKDHPALYCHSITVS